MSQLMHERAGISDNPLRIIQAARVAPRDDELIGPDERDARFGQLAAFFAGGDAVAARRALDASGARFVLVPVGVAPVRAALDPLELAYENAAGRLYRVPSSASVPP